MAHTREHHTLPVKQAVESKLHKQGVIGFVSAEPLLKHDSPRDAADFLNDVLVVAVCGCRAITWKRQKGFHRVYKVQGGERVSGPGCDATRPLLNFDRHWGWPRKKGVKVAVNCTVGTTCHTTVTTGQRHGGGRRSVSNTQRSGGLAEDNPFVLFRSSKGTRCVKAFRKGTTSLPLSFATKQRYAYASRASNPTAI